MGKFLQPSLSGGELAPGLRGRVDLARYTISVGRCRNMITKPTGGVAKRPGTIFRGRAKFGTKLTRLIPFVYSTETKYLIEAGDQYLRFWVNGALLTSSTKTITGITQANPAVVTATAHGFSNGDQVLIQNVQGMSRLNSRTYTVANVAANTFELSGINTTTYAAYTSGGTASKVVEVATPYTEARLPGVRFTQSADVLYLVCGDVPIKELRRLTGSSFELRDFAFRRGPFRAFNSNEAAVMASSGRQGVVTITTNLDTFTANDVGMLVYMEEKELRSIRPWASAEKNITVGQLRRSDQKVYKVSAIATGGSVGTPYRITGATRPTHPSGRAWDGPGDIKNDGVNDYAVGAEWEFVHNTFGIVQITAYTSATSVTAVVIERIPDSLLGIAPAPLNTWNISGDGTTTAFPVVGAISSNPFDYRVTIGGVPVQSNPYYPGGGGVDGGDGGNVRPGGPGGESTGGATP